MTIRELVQKSSVYIVSQIGHSKTLSRKIMWLSILTTVIMICCYQIYAFFDQYFKYPVVVDLQIEGQDAVDFPAVTVCNLNRMKSEYEACLYDNSTASNCMYFEAGKDMGSFALPERRSIHACEIKFKGKHRKNTDAAIEFLQHYSNLELTKRELFGHQYSDMIKACLFNWMPCSFKLDPVLSFQYGNCFTFKAKAPYIQKPWKATSAGSRGALELILDVKPQEYVPISHTIGMKIVIHNPNDMPDPESDGVSIFPGYETHISLRQSVIRRLPAPYKDECISYTDNPLLQSQAQCMQDCLQEYNYKQCGCVEPSLPTKSNMRHCTVTNTTELCCLDAVINDLASYGADCKCPFPCLTTYYNERLTMAKWPSKAFFLKGVYNSTAEDIKAFRKTHVKVKIFFSTQERIEYVQKPVFLESEVFSHLGGELNLWLGLSIIVIFELIEALLYFIKGKSRVF
ncbi:acid-sensing ion channel 5 [Caerostris darwini]|uniref:Acid-sensing ion channel 5 n=1 Tax=Caerostris darwini TaxID=1538125 RepID=A0AAV4T1X8_9ARAC|nr:acid-sensing ion channel 5 [Caerostris darwini]